MIKKILCGVLVVGSLIGFSACGNMSMGMGNYNFRHIHFGRNGEDHSATVEKWYDTGNPGLEVKTEEYGAMFLSEGTYELFENESKCSYCSK